MVVVEGGTQIECPVLSEWVKMDELVQRAAKGHVALVRGKAIDRSTLADNHELLQPLLVQYGNLQPIHKGLNGRLDRPCKFSVHFHPPRHEAKLGCFGGSYWQVLILLQT